MASPQPIGIDSMPEEIRNLIIRCIPVRDLPNVMLSSRAFYKQAKPYLYRSIYHLVESTRPMSERDAFVTSNSDNPIYVPRCSAQIVQSDKFLRTITESLELQSWIDKANFFIQGGIDDGEEATLKKCFSILNLSTLHLTLAYNNATLALTSTVTSLDIMYPAEEELDDLYDSLRDQIYSLFNIPSLHYLSLRCARRWNAFSPIPDNSRVGTSNVVSLSLPSTVPMDTDLQEILTWPKGLKCIHHESIEGPDSFFQNNGNGKISSPEQFLLGIASQRESLEEISYNNGDDCCGTDESTFSPVLMGKFTKLIHMSVHRDCLVGFHGGPHSLYTVLPPNLRELYLDQDGDIRDAGYQARLREWLQEVIDHKEECFPSLATVVLWQWESYDHFDDYRAEEYAILERLGLGPAFKGAGIRLEFVFRASTDSWASNLGEKSTRFRPE